MRFPESSLQQELLRGLTRLPLEEADEVLGILEAQHFRHLFCSGFRGEQRAFCKIHHLELDEFLSCLSRLRLDKVAEIVG